MSKKGKRKTKRKSYQKRNGTVLFLLVIVAILTYIIIQKREDESYASVTSASIGDIIDLIESGQADVSRYIVYGTHLNIEGNIGITNPEIDDVQVVAKKSSGEEITVDTTYDYESRKLSFSTLDKINTGLDLESLDVDNYYILLKITSSNGEENYYSLSNDTEYTKPIEYYTLTRNNSNNRIDIRFLTQNSSSALVLSVTKANKLPDNVYDVVIDPGHGGNDAGAISGRYQEDEIVLENGLELKKKLEYLGLKVLITRDGTETDEYDTYNIYDEDGRVTMANESGAKILISLHMNSNESDFVDGGVEVYAAPNMDLSLAKLFADNIVEEANTSYSEMQTDKEEDGVYVRTIEIQNRNSSTFRGYKGIYDSIPYLFIIREIGGTSTGAYVNGSNPSYGENIYRNSNVGVEGYLIELGYMNVNNDLRNVLNNGDSYMQAITDSINSYYKIK